MPTHQVLPLTGYIFKAIYSICQPSGLTKFINLQSEFLNLLAGIVPLTYRCSKRSLRMPSACAVRQ